MNILFFLKPKSEVAFIYDHSTLRQVLETMEFHKYASIPMLNKAGEYVGTITEGDLLWGIKKYTHLNVKEAETIFIQDFPRKADHEAVSAAVTSGTYRSRIKTGEKSRHTREDDL